LLDKVSSDHRETRAKPLGNMSLYEENAAILRGMEINGADLVTPRRVDFAHVFPDRSRANAFAQKAKQDGFEISVEEVEREEDPWDVTVSRALTPTCENITSIEEHLDTVARSYQGRADGWGFFTN